MDARPNIVLVHGAWADGSCWSGVIERLQAAGYHVTAPQFPMTALADDVARLRQVLDVQDGPTIVVNHFAADVDPVRAKVMHAVQQALAGSTFTDVMGVPAWKSLPSWFLVATEDQAIPPDGERLFARRMGATTIEVPSSHVAMVSHPDQVAQLITAAAEACSASVA
jgi:pimeloyl-ACP methyl ester carboxylesterase